MQSIIFHSFFSFASAWCVALAVLGTSLVQAADFKPFLTLKIAGPGTFINIVEKINNTLDSTGVLGIKEVLTPYKNLPGVNINGTIGLALQANEDSPLKLDAVLILPIANLTTFNVPGQEMFVGMVRDTIKAEGNNKYTFNSSWGVFVLYQKTGYVVVAPESTAEFASTADPKKLFIDLDKFTLGMSVNLENISLETIESILESTAGLLAMQGRDLDLKKNLNNITEIFDEISSFTTGLFLDERTLDFSVSTLTVPQKYAEIAEKFQKVKNLKTIFGGFLQDTSKTIFSCNYLDYLTDNEVEEMVTAFNLVCESFLQGFNETIEEEEGNGKKLAQLMEIICDWMQDILEFYGYKGMVNAAFSFDSDGTFLYAEAIDEPELILNIAEKLYDLLPELFEDGGEALQKNINDKIEWDYETVAGFSLSCLPNLFSDMPSGSGLPQALEELPMNLFWAVKADEAVAVAIGLDFSKTEQTLKAALEKTKTSVLPKQTAVFALKPLGEFLQKQVLPFAEKTEMKESEIKKMKELLAVVTSVDANAKVVVTTEFPGNSKLQKVQISGKALTALIKVTSAGFVSK